MKISLRNFVAPLQAKQLGSFPEHLGLVTSWYQDAWGHIRPTDLQYSSNLLKTRLSTETLPIAYIVFCNDTKVPIATFTLTQNINGVGDPNLINLNNIYVVKECRRNGVGAQVIQIAEQIAREKFNIQTLQLFITDLKLEKFYTSLGWEKTETTALKTSTGQVPAVVLTKQLSVKKVYVD